MEREHARRLADKVMLAVADPNHPKGGMDEYREAISRLVDVGDEEWANDAVAALEDLVYYEAAAREAELSADTARQRALEALEKGTRP